MPRRSPLVAPLVALVLLFTTGGAAVATTPEQRAAVAVDVALRQVGLPFVWGGNGPENGDRGFDCSGLTAFAYGKAGVVLPRTAHAQYRRGPRVPGGSPLLPGDLVFYGTVDKVHHVGLFVSQDRMVSAPTFGLPVQTSWYRWRGDDYLGATRPSRAADGVPDPAVRETPDPSIPDDTWFDAPAAPPLPR
ncbi:C40 family peptidase [Pseudonocardia sp. ICBG1293]|uniref:C40 family peptidase n=1 Tax=Pseudonocardia sp. ICBG1293 TaxID=2844382 RepID=UPI0027E08DF6|nr:C40 family peptidase [Pseudonocardia sp. ICBG1293]